MRDACAVQHRCADAGSFLWNGIRKGFWQRMRQAAQVYLWQSICLRQKSRSLGLHRSASMAESCRPSRRDWPHLIRPSREPTSVAAVQPQEHPLPGLLVFLRSYFGHETEFQVETDRGQAHVMRAQAGAVVT